MGADRQIPVATLACHTRIPAELRNAAFTRAHGRCDHCGRHLDPDDWATHRRSNQRTTAPSIAELVALHPGCHTTVHAHPDHARRLGLTVPAGADPARVPVLLHGRYPRWAAEQWAAARTRRTA